MDMQPPEFEFAALMLFGGLMLTVVMGSLFALARFVEKLK